MIITSGTFTSATEMLGILHTFLTTSAGYTANRIPTIAGNYKYSNYYKSVTAFGKTNNVYLNVAATFGPSFDISPSFSNGGNSYKDNYLWGLCYSLSSGYDPGQYVNNQPGVLHENSSNFTVIAYQHFRDIGLKQYFISSDGNSLFINIYRGDSTKVNGDNASIYLCGVVNPKGAGNYIGGTLLSGFGDGTMYYDCVGRDNTPKYYNNTLFAMGADCTVFTLTTSATSGNMYMTRNASWYNSNDDVYFKRLLTNVGLGTNFYLYSGYTDQASTLEHIVSPARYSNSKLMGSALMSSFDSITGTIKPTPVRLYAHRGSERYCYVGEVPNVMMCPILHIIQTLNQYDTFEYNGETWMLVAFYAVKV